MRSPVLSRRQVLRAAATSAATATAIAATPRAAASATGHSLVVVMLRGGLDGLHAIVPTDTGHYRDNGLRTAGPRGGLIGLGDGFGLHPALRPLAEFYRSGDLAPVVAVGSPLDSRSHFDQQAALDLGLPGRLDHPTGWLGRHLSVVRGTGVLRGFSNGSRLATSLRGAPRSTALDALERFEIPFVDEESPVEDAFLAAAGDGPFGAAANDALAISKLVTGRNTPLAEPSVAYPETTWGGQFADAARLLRSSIGVEIAVLDLAGWDTHVLQGGSNGRLADRLADLAGSLAAFLHDVRDLGDRVTVVVASEFGRRVRENGGGGTDHGRGGVAFVAGRGIRGGRVHGDWPGIGAGDLVDGDVRVTTDIRDVFGEVLAQRVGTDLGHVFPEHSHKPVGLL